MLIKACTKCGEEKPYSAEYFFRRKDSPCGLMASCKVCKMAAADDYWNKREGGRALKNKRYWAARPGAYAAYQRDQRKIKKEKYCEYESKRYLKNRDKRLAWSHEWQKRNLDKARLYQAKHRALKYSNGGNVTKAHIEFMWTQQGGRCFYCRIMLDASYHLEHKVPVSRNGIHSQENVCLSCKLCNSRKGTLTAEEFILKLTRMSA